MTDLEKNLAKIQELVPHVRWAGEQMVRACWDADKKFRITEAYRSQKRQNELYAQGRTKKGNIVTWTRSSRHTDRLAIDVYPLNCTFEEIEKIANQFGIKRPKQTVALGDYGHFEFIEAKQPPPPKKIYTGKALERRVDRLKEPQRSRAKKRLKRAIIS